MAGCDGWITIKIFQLIFATFCMIYKRVTDHEANKLFYFLQKYSREWPLLNNITWEENGAIFSDITYGGYIIIIIGLIIGQCSGELQRCRKTENFFLVLGALLFIAAGSLELAAIESVEERLVDNAAILGVISLVTGFLFIVDLLCAGKRRKREKLKVIEKYTQSKPTQTEDGKSGEGFTTNYPHGYQNGKAHLVGDVQNGARIPRNGVKLLPTSPTMTDLGHDDFGKTTLYPVEPPLIDKNEIKTHEGKIKATESFLLSERGFYQRRKTEQDRLNNIMIPAGYALVALEQLQKSKPKSDSGIGDSPTPPGYAKIIPDAKGKPGYVIIPIDQKDGGRKLQSPTVSTRDSPEFYYLEKQERKPKSPNLYRSHSTMNSSDVSDAEEPKYGDVYKQQHKIALEYLERSRKYASDDSSDERKTYPSDFRPESRHSLRGLKEWRYPKGQTNEGYADDLILASKKSSPYRSRASSPEKPKSILRFDYGRSSKRENGLYLPKDGRYDSLDSQKIAEDLRTLREITKSDLDLTGNLEKENKILKERLKVEKKEKEKLKHKLEDRKKVDESEEEKNRRISEREEQYFGIKDLRQSHSDRFEAGARKGAKEINEKLKQKHQEAIAAKEAQEFRDLIDEKFHFLHEEDKKRKEVTSPTREQAGKPGMSEVQSAPDLTGHAKKSDSDEMTSTDEEIKLRVGTPGSYKSEALFWLGSDREHQTKSNTPTSPGSPGYVLYTAQNWPESPSPEDRFQFSAKEAQHLTLGTPPKTPVLERKPDFTAEEKKNSQKLRLLEFEEVPEESEKSSPRKGLLVRKVDFPKEPVTEIKKPAVVQGSTSTWRKWLYPKPKLQHTRSVPD